MNQFDKQTERNLKAKKLEKSGQVKKAIDLYEKNVSEGFYGNFPYDRLAIIYSKNGLIDDEIRILTKAISVFQKVSNQGRADGQPKLEKFLTRLKKVEEKKNKNAR